MTENPEGYRPKIVPINSESEITLGKHSLRFDAGHVNFMEQRYPHFFENEFSTVYSLSRKEGADLNLATIDLDGLLESRFVRDPKYLAVFFRFTAAQFKNEVQGTIGSRDLFLLRGESYKTRYQTSRESFTRLKNTLTDFLEKFNSLQVDSSGFSADIGEITKTFEWENKLPKIT